MVSTILRILFTINSKRNVRMVSPYNIDTTLSHTFQKLIFDYSSPKNDVSDLRSYFVLKILCDTHVSFYHINILFILFQVKEQSLTVTICQETALDLSPAEQKLINILINLVS